MLWSEKLNNIQKILIKLHNLEKLESSEVLFCNLLIDANEVNRDADMSETEKKNLIINTLLEEKRNLLIHNKQFGLIHRNDPKAGFGSYVFTIVRDIYTCLMDNRIPIIDLDSCKTPFDKMDEGKNRWDSFFKQPFNLSIEDIPTNQKYPVYECSGMDLMVDFIDNKSLQSFWHSIYKKYMCYTDDVKAYLEREYENYFHNIEVNNVIGILARGSDINAVKPRGHWVQPSAETLIKHARWLMEKEGYEYVFLATEDLEIYQKFLKEFGDKRLLVTKTKFLDYTKCSDYIIDAQRRGGIDMYQNNLDYLSALYQLSKLKCFLAGNCTGTMGVLIMTEGFDYQYVYNTGRYGVDDKDTLNKKLQQLC